jgi:hypothetical protein
MLALLSGSGVASDELSGLVVVDASGTPEYSFRNLHPARALDPGVMLMIRSDGLAELVASAIPARTHVCIHACMHARSYAHARTRARTHTHTHTHAHAHTHARTHACVHVRMHMQ